MRIGSPAALGIGLIVGFVGGFLTAAQLSKSSVFERQDPTRQDLLKQLVATKSGIESGLTVGDLRKSETELRTAFDLASNGLNDRQRPAVAAALHAVTQTVAVWDETLTKCHAGSDGYVGLGEEVEAASSSWNPKRNNKKLKVIYADMGVLGELTKWEPPLNLAPKRGTLLQPLFSVSLDRIQAAIDTLH